MSPEPASRRVLVTGAAGMLGSQLLRTAPAGVEAVGTDLRAAPERDDGPGVDAVGVDLAEPDQVAGLLDFAGPFAGVIHGAAYTAVDRAEHEPELAERVNTVAAGVVAQACAARDLPLLVVSTDFVFDGRKRRPYAPEDPPAPLGVYGRTKLAGERRALRAWPGGTRVVRTQWLYGPRGSHFPGTILRLARERHELSVVSDQVGSPTSTLELAPALWDILLRGEPGIWHAACEGSCSWYDLAVALLQEAGVIGCLLKPCTTEEFPRPAPRPAYSVLDCSRLTALRGQSLAPWRRALAEFLEHESGA